MNKKCIIINSSGFTLVEMLVASTIFVIIVISITSIFTLGIGSQRRIMEETNIQQESQMAMEILSKKIRKSLIDYNYYNNNKSAWPEADNILSLKDPENILYKKEEKVLKQSTDNGLSWHPVTTPKVEIRRLDFYIYPKKDPFDPDDPQNFQPRVTIVLKVGAGTKEMTLQQTIPQRFTERR